MSFEQILYQVSDRVATLRTQHDEEGRHLPVAIEPGLTFRPGTPKELFRFAF